MIQPLTEIQEKWLTALESGKYEQGAIYLNKGGNFCCLGVACEILHVPAFTDHGMVTYYDDCNSAAPPFVVKTLGLYSHLGDDCTYDNPSNTLIERSKALSILNDAGTSFAEIAQIIRANPAVYLRADICKENSDEPVG